MNIQSIYWKNRCTIRWVKFGGENSKKIHAKATERYRHNVINEIKDEHGNTLINHNDKADALWRCYKNRMGVSTGVENRADLSDLIQEVDNLHCLSAEFSNSEIEDVVKYMKTDKEPGSDGFNGAFVKKCWHIIKDDFIKLCHDFHKGLTPLESINGSYITLVPKNSPETLMILDPFLSQIPV